MQSFNYKLLICDIKFQGLAGGLFSLASSHINCIPDGHRFCLRIIVFAQLLHALNRPRQMAKLTELVFSRTEEDDAGQAVLR